VLIIHLFWDRLTNLVSRNINFRNFQGMKKYLGFLTKGKETFLLSMLCFLGTNFDLVGQCAVMPVGQTICAGEAITLEIPGVSSVVWSDGTNVLNSATPKVAPLNTTTYTATYASLNNVVTNGDFQSGVTSTAAPADNTLYTNYQSWGTLNKAGTHHYQANPNVFNSAANAFVFSSTGAPSGAVGDNMLIINGGTANEKVLYMIMNEASDEYAISFYVANVNGDGYKEPYDLELQIEGVPVKQYSGKEEGGFTQYVYVGNINKGDEITLVNKNSSATMGNLFAIDDFVVAKTCTGSVTITVNPDSPSIALDAVEVGDCEMSTSVQATVTNGAFTAWTDTYNILNNETVSGATATADVDLTKDVGVYSVSIRAKNSSSGCELEMTNVIHVKECYDPIIFCEGETAAEIIPPTAVEFTKWVDPNGVSHDPDTEPFVPIETGTYEMYYYQEGKNNLIPNPDFEGMTKTEIEAFSDYTYKELDGINHDLSAGNGDYTVGTNPWDFHRTDNWYQNMSDHGGSGNMLIVDGSSMPGAVLYRTSVWVQPATDYIFTGWFANIHGLLANPFDLNFDIDGEITRFEGAKSGGIVPYGGVDYPEGVAGWIPSPSSVWNSGGAVGDDPRLITIQITNNNIGAWGNDIGIDDLEFIPVVKEEIEVTVKPTPVVDLPSTYNIAAGSNVTIGVNKVTPEFESDGTTAVDYEYVWEKGSTYSDPTTLTFSGAVGADQKALTTPADGDEYGVWAKYADAPQCISAVATTTINHSLQVNASADPVCEDEQGTIKSDYVGADKYEWYRVETAGDVLVSGATSKDYSPATNDANDYYVVITVGGSTAQSNAVSITYNDKPDITLDATASICQDGTLALNPSFTGGTADYTYEWTNDRSVLQNALTGTLNSTGSLSNDVNTSSADVYNVNFKVTDVNGCSDNQDVEITVLEKPKVTLDATFTFCPELTSMPIAPTQVLPALTTGSYTLNWYDSNDASGGITYTGASYDVVGTSDGDSYSVIATHPNGCPSDFKATTVSLHNAVTVDVLNPEVCENTQGTLTADGKTAPDYTFNWYLADNTGVKTGISLGTGLSYQPDYNSPLAKYILEAVEVATTCVGVSAATAVPYRAAPVYNGSTKEHTCAGTDAQLEIDVTEQAGMTYTYTWDFDGATASATTTSDQDPLILGTSTIKDYLFDLTIKDGICTVNVNDIPFSVYPLPTITIADEVVCVNSALTLSPQVTGGIAPYDFTWGTNQIIQAPLTGTIPVGSTQTTKVVDTSLNGDYTLQFSVEDAKGCEAQTEIDVSITALPTAPDLTPEVCDGKPYELVDHAASNLSYTSFEYGGTVFNVGDDIFNAGEYTVTVLEDHTTYTCENTGKLTLTVHEKPVVSISDNSICTGEDRILQITDVQVPGQTTTLSDFTFQWLETNNPTTVLTENTSQVTVPKAEENYSVVATYTGGTGCSSDAVFAKVTEGPLVVSLQGNEVCADANGTLSILSPVAELGNTYTWMKGSTDVTVDASQNTFSTPPGDDSDYTVIVTKVSGCTGTSNVANVTVNAIPEVDIAPLFPFCTGQTQMELSVINVLPVASYDYYWYDKVVTNTTTDPEDFFGATYDLAAAGKGAGTYSIIVADQVTGCKSEAKQTKAEIASNITVPVAVNDACQDSQGLVYTTLTGSNYNYQWYEHDAVSGTNTALTGEISEEYIPAANATTQYVVGLEETTSGCTGISGPVSVSYRDKPVLNAFSKTATCFGNEAQLVVDITAPLTDDKYDFIWNFDGASIVSGTEALKEPTVANDAAVNSYLFDLKVKDDLCDVDFDDLSFAVNAIPEVVLNDTLVCASETRALKPASVTIPGGSSTSTFTYSWFERDDASKTELWTTEKYSGVDAETYYSLIVTNPTTGCVSNEVSAKVTQSPWNIEIAANVVCADENGTLEALNVPANSSGYTFTWIKNGLDVSTTSVSTYTIPALLDEDVYTVRVVKNQDCYEESTNSASVSYNPLPVYNGISSLERCDYEPYTLPTAPVGSGEIYNWVDQFGIAAPATVEQTGIYTVNITDANGCKASGTVDLTVHDVREFEVESPGYCRNADWLLTALPLDNNPFTASDYSFGWSNGATGNEMTPADDATYTVTITDVHACVTTASGQITIYEHPEPVIIGDELVCPGENGTIEVENGSSYSTILWNDNSNLVLREVPGSDVEYSVTVWDANGCDGISPAFRVIERVTPEYELNQDTVICFNESAILDAFKFDDPKTVYSWTLNGEPFADTRTITVTEPGTYTSKVNDGCYTFESSASVVVDPLPQFSIIDVTLAGAVGVQAEGGLVPYQYKLVGERSEFNEYGYSPSFTDVWAGQYNLHVLDANGCHNQTIVDVPYPDLIIPNFFTPNEDGYNDRWVIGNIEQYPNAKVIIYNRFGKVIKEFGADSYGWDGMYNGNPVQQDSYWYVIVQGYKNLVYKGYVTLVRKEKNAN